jgi:hypothetical protein
MVALSPATVPIAIPKIMYPIWLTSVNESSLLMSAWATAPRIPTTMVSRATTKSTSPSALPGNRIVSVRMIA